MARVQIRNPSDGRDYYERKKADGKAPMEAMRCVNRRLSDIVYQQMLNDTTAPTTTGPGGHQATSTNSSMTDSHPHAGSSEKSLPAPAAGKPRPRPGPLLDGKDGGRLGDLRPGFCLDSAPVGLDALFVICRPEAAEAFQRRRAGQT
jgi:hypothetical protein